MEHISSPNMLRRVLLVEDHDGFRQVLGKFLSEKFDVIGAKNGLEAISWLSNGLVPDVIVTDKDMPEIDGSELLQQLRASGIWSQVPVVVIGESNDGAEAGHYYRSLGAQEYFSKPFDPFQLQEKLLKLSGST
ncbi:MAG: response regulator [Saprospiraceae bacterium]|nr:response regulator [Saprospiraceae bacterium]MCB0845364.1 response regulator [Bacteroidota bacterium]MCB9342760.1 response regulator [Lewinellaceae bacterium]